MWSLTSCQAVDMEWLIWLSLLLTYLPVTESVEDKGSCLSQPHNAIWRKKGEKVVLNCTISSDCSAKDWQYEWFSFKENSHIRLPLDNSLKYRLEKASLCIESLQADDSGIYYCAAVSNGEPVQGTQHVGLGTPLVVTEKPKMVRPILLWLSFVLLAIYSLAVVTLIVKKNGCEMRVCKTVRKTSLNNSMKKVQFRDVLQEMYSRGNLERSKLSANSNRSQAEAASTDLNNSNDDIYQNV